MRWGLIGFLVMLGCGDKAEVGADADLVCVATESNDYPNGMFSRPSDFSEIDCQPGALAGVDTSGLWVFEGLEPGSGGPVVKIGETCEVGLSATLGRVGVEEFDFSSLSDDELLLRSADDYESFQIVRSYYFCEVNDDGHLIGQVADCFRFGGDDWQCSENPVVVRPFTRLPGETLAQGVELVAQFTGPPQDPWGETFTANVAIHNGFAYVARYFDGLRIVDVSDVASLREVGRYPAERDRFNDVQIVVHDGSVYALVASEEQGVVVLEVTEPSSPQMVRAITGLIDSVHRLSMTDVDGRKLIYAADGNSPVVQVYDATNPRDIVLVSDYVAPDLQWRVHAAFGEQDYLYAASIEALVMVDISNPDAPEVVGHYEADYSHAAWPMTVNGRKIVLHGDEGLGAHLQVLDGDPASPEFMQVIGAYPLRRQVSIHNFKSVGNTAYVAHYQDGLRIFDLDDPTAPVMTGYYNTWDPETAPGAYFEGASDIEVGPDGTIYVTDTPGGLFILREQD